MRHLFQFPCADYERHVIELTLQFIIRSLRLISENVIFVVILFFVYLCYYSKVSWMIQIKQQIDWAPSTANLNWLTANHC